MDADPQYNVTLAAPLSLPNHSEPSTDGSQQYNHPPCANFVTNSVTSGTYGVSSYAVREQLHVLLQLLPRTNLLFSRQFLVSLVCCHHAVALPQNLVATKGTRFSLGTSLNSKISSTTFT